MNFYSTKHEISEISNHLHRLERIASTSTNLKVSQRQVQSSHTHGP